MLARLVSIALGASLLIGGSAAGQELAIIVNAQRSPSLTEEDLRQIYLKKRSFWREGGRIVPINRNAGSEVRRLFERFLFEQSPQQLGIYWNRQYFLGVLPPATLASDEAVLRFVAGEPRAIGYVRASTADESVRIIRYVVDGQTSVLQPPPSTRAAPADGDPTRIPRSQTGS